MFKPVAAYGYRFHTVYLFMADIANPDLFVCVCRTWTTDTDIKNYIQHIKNLPNSVLTGDINVHYGTHILMITEDKL